jgi:Radical SAM superfamily/4Fe-4S single cluster domain
MATSIANKQRVMDPVVARTDPLAPPELLRPIQSSAAGSCDDADSAVVRTIGECFEEVEGISYQNASILKFGGHRYIVSHRAILTIVVVAACNAACKFCSNEITFTPTGRYVSFDEKLARTKQFALLAGISKVAFTGGEPTLYPQGLADLTEAVIPGFRRARLHTNGTRLFDLVEGLDGAAPLLTALKRNGLTGVSVSVAHSDPEVNQSVMRWKRGTQPAGEDILERIAQNASSSFSVRLSCVMTADSVATPADMLEYMSWGRRLGYRRFIFRTCSQIPDPFQKPTEYSRFNSLNAQPIDELARYFEARAEFELVFRQRKTDSKVDVYHWGDCTFDVDESSEEVDLDAKIRRLNFMPDGVTYTSWIDPQSVLFQDDSEVARRSAQRELLLPVPQPRPELS